MVLLVGTASCVGGADGLSATAEATNEVNRMAQLMSFEALAQLRGQPYVTERDRLFREQPDLLQLTQSFLDVPRWEVRIQAKILQGWLVDHELYRQLIVDLDHVDVERERKTVVGISRVWDMYALRAEREYGERILPLAWETIFKLPDEYPDWQVVTFLRMVAAVPSDESIEPVIKLLTRTRSPLLRSAAAQTLAKLPRPAVVERLDALQMQDAGVLQAIQDARGRFE